MAVVFCSCHDVNNNSRTQLNTLTDTVKKITATKQKIEWKEIEDEDSIQLEVMLKDLLRIANQYKWKKSFRKELSAWDYQNASCSASLSFGYLFSKKEKHLITRRSIAESEIHIDIFLLQGNKFKHLLAKNLGMMGYLDDAVKDVNGDFYKDFLFHWYPSSGCCRRDVYDVYLYNGVKHVFSKEYEFINPTFSSKEKIIRGVEYGQPGDAALYKYKWNGSVVDTIEFIYPDTKGRFYLSKVDDYHEALQKGRLLKSLPTEYRNIESIDWFLAY